MGKLRYRGKSVIYDFHDQYGKRHQPALGIIVDRIRKNPQGKDVFPEMAIAIKNKIDTEVLLGTWGLDEPEAEPAKECIKLQAGFDLFIKSYRNEHTKACYQTAFDRLLAHFNDIPVDQITEDKLLDWRKTYLDQGKDSTAEFAIRHLKTYFKYLVDRKHIQATPFTKEVLMEQADKEIVIFEEGEDEIFFRKLLKNGELEAHNQLKFLLLSGWRVSDSCDLTRDKINFERRVIAHYIGKKRKFWEYPMDTELVNLLGRIPKRKDGFVFEFRDYHDLDKIFRRIADDDHLGENGEELSLRNHKALHVHTLRKQFTYNCFRRGVPLEICSKLLGHASIATTQKYYTYWDTNHLRDNLELSRHGRLQIGDMALIAGNHKAV